MIRKLAATYSVIAYDALSMVVAADAERDYRQIAVLGATGSIAAHTGSKAIAHAGHVETATGSFQANMMANPGVPEAMEAAFSAGAGQWRASVLGWVGTGRTRRSRGRRTDLARRVCPRSELA